MSFPPWPQALDIGIERTPGSTALPPMLRKQLEQRRLPDHNRPAQAQAILRPLTAAALDMIFDLIPSIESEVRSLLHKNDYQSCQDVFLILEEIEGRATEFARRCAGSLIAATHCALEPKPGRASTPVVLPTVTFLICWSVVYKEHQKAFGVQRTNEYVAWAIEQIDKL